MTSDESTSISESFSRTDNTAEGCFTTAIPPATYTVYVYDVESDGSVSTVPAVVVAEVNVSAEPLPTSPTPVSSSTCKISLLLINVYTGVLL